MNKSKTDVRLIESDFAERYLPKSLTPKPSPEPTPIVIPGLSFTVDGPSQRVRSMQALTDEILKARVLEGAASLGSASDVADASAKLTDFREALDKGLDNAGRSARLTKKRLAAADRISDATDDINLALHAVVDALQTNNFKAEDLDDSLKELCAAIGKLSKTATRNVDVADAGEGLAWLRAAGELSTPF
jgi:hypothetical protein